MKRLLCVLSACLLLCPCAAVAADPAQQDILVEGNNLYTILGDGRTMFALDDDGNLFPYLPKTHELGEPVASISTEEVYPVVMNGKLYGYRKEDEALLCLWPLGDETLISAPISRSLTGGGEDWSLSALRMREDALYFLYSDAGGETPVLCRYRFADQGFDWIKTDGLQEYVLADDGETLVISQKQEETVVQAVDWQGREHRELYRLPGQFRGFAADGERLYAADIGELDLVSMEEGKIVTRAHSPYASGVRAGQAVDGRYYALGHAGLYAPGFTAEQESMRVLRVYGGYADEIDRQFMLEHPDVKIEYIPGTVEGMDFSEAIITGVLNFDVGSLSNVTSAAKQLMEKGYALDLSISPALQEKAAGMYEPIRNFIFQDGKLMMIPYHIRVNDLLEYNGENLRAAGLTADQLPSTLEELLDFIIRWYAEHEELRTEEDIIPLLMESPYDSLLYNVLEAYAAHYRRTGKDLDFDTAEFRKLLDKAKKAADVSPIQTEFVYYQHLFDYTGKQVPGIHSLVFPLAEDESPRYQGQITGYIIDPRTREQALAIAYIEWRMENVDALNHIMLYKGAYSALEREDYPDYLARWTADKKLLEAALAKAESALEKRDLQERIDQATQRIENPEDGMRYRIAEAEIVFYQEEIMPNIEFPFNNGVTEVSRKNQDTIALIRRYLDGQVDQEAFIKELNRREMMIRIENQ